MTEKKPGSSYSDAARRRFREHSRSMTQSLRTGQEGRWRNLRDKLAEVGVELQDAALAELGPDDYKMEVGLIVTRGSRCFLFTLDWSTTEEGESEGNYDDAWIWNWREMKRSDLQGYEAESAAAADAVLTGSTGADGEDSSLES